MLDDGPPSAAHDASKPRPFGMFMIEAPAHRVSHGDMRTGLPLDEVFKLVLQRKAWPASANTSASVVDFNFRVTSLDGDHARSAG